MTGPDRPNTVVTGAPAMARVIQVGTPHDMVSTSPSVPLVIPIVFPVLVSQLLNVSTSEKPPVRLL